MSDSQNPGCRLSRWYCGCQWQQHCCYVCGIVVFSPRVRMLSIFAAQRQTAVTAHLKSEQLLLFVFALRICDCAVLVASVIWLPPPPSPPATDGITTNSRRRPNYGLELAHCLRRCPNQSWWLFLWRNSSRIGLYRIISSNDPEKSFI